MVDFRHMSGEALHTYARRMDKLLGQEIERLQMSDERFKTVLEAALAAEDEINRRKNGKPPETT